MIATDLSWLSQEAQNIHQLFTSVFYSFLTVLLLIGVLMEYFKFPLGGMPNFATLIGRAFVAGLLLIAYPEISNWTAEITDALSMSIGGLNDIHEVNKKVANVFEDYSLSWTNLGESFIFIVAYLAYFILHITIFFFDAAVLFGLTLLYIFSPILIALFVLPSTAGATKMLFRSLFELSSWKIVWSVLSVLLWSTALKNLENAGTPEGLNFVVTLTYIVILSLSLLLTPKVVSGLFNSGIANVSGGLVGLGAAAVTMGGLTPRNLVRFSSKGIGSGFRFLNKRRKRLPSSKQNNEKQSKHAGSRSLRTRSTKPNSKKS